MAILWFLYAHNPSVVLSTAPTFRQVRHVLWRQIRQLYFRSKEPLGGKILDARWELSEDRYAMGLSADTADQFQGFHNPNIFIVVDEAEGVSDEIYEAIDSVMTSAETSRLLLIGNPTTVSGAFRRDFHEERSLYHAITISALDSPNVLEGKIVIPGLTTEGWIQERQEIWGEDNPLYRARVLGEFPDQGYDTLIRLSDIEAATKYGPSDSPVGAVVEDPAMSQPAEETIIAVDVARFGSDQSVIVRRRGRRVEEIQAFRGLDTMQLAGRIAAAILQFRPDRVMVDEIGVGAGVVDRLREQGFPVKGINVARSALQNTVFANLRAEGYWRLRDLFAAGELRIPSDNQLMGELASLRYSYDSLGRLLMESKDDMRSRGLTSPDRADALMLAFVEPSAKAKLWT